MRTLLSIFLSSMLAAMIGCGSNPNPSGQGGSGQAGSGQGGGGQGGSGQGGGGQGGSGQGGSGAGDISGPLTIDTSYGEQGMARADCALSTDNVFAAAWLADGSLLVGRTTDPASIIADGLLARYTPAGQIDASHGEAGSVLLPIADGARVTSIEALPDGGALVAGVSFRPSSNLAFIVHINAQGALDTTFGNGGIAPFIFPELRYHAVISRSDTGQI